MSSHSWLLLGAGILVAALGFGVFMVWSYWRVPFERPMETPHNSGLRKW
jgi:hypothetical protein